MRAADLARTTAARLRAARPAPLLAALCLIQLALVAWFALRTPHNGWLWYSGGDATEYWTSSWSLAHGEIPQAVVGYGVPVLYAWVPLVTGATLMHGLPVIAVLQAGLLVPLALVLFWAVADLLFGRLFAWWAAALWVLGPLLMLAGFRSDYDPRFEQYFLVPHWYGLTNMADLPALVAVLATTWAALRLLERRTVEDAVLAGLLAGVMIGIKPANGFFLPALAILLLAVRQVRPLLAWGAGFAPPLLALALWKHEGLGTLPLTSYAPAHVAAGPSPIVASSANTYVKFNWAHLHHELLDLREVFWSLRLLEFVAFAGIAAVCRRSPLKGAFIAVWFVAFCLVKGSSERSEVATANYFRFTEPGLPAYILLAGALVFLVPRRGRAFERPAAARRLPGGRRTVLAAAAILAAVPLLVILVAAPAATAHYVRVNALANDAPLSNGLAVSTGVSGGAVSLAWRRPGSGSSRAYFVVYRSAKGDGCSTPPAGAAECLLEMEPVGTTRGTSFTDRPGTGRHWYRVGEFANYRDLLDGSDLMLMGPASAAG